MTSTQTTINNINRWNNLIQAFYNQRPGAREQILNHLLEGEYFEVNRLEYEYWKSINPPYIHCYLGINANNRLEFYLLDSINDAQGNFNNHIFPKDYLPSQDQGDHDIEETEVIERKNNWQQFNNQWLNEINQNTNPILRAVQISFSDYQDIFNAPTQKCSNFFGLRNAADTSFQHEIEIIIGTMMTTTESESEYYVDVTRPVPPFGGGESLSDYKLLS